jgi:HPt (histidine-containing phosphotransfer) domain-containing protein
MSSGLDDYLTKPIDWRALDRVLGRYAPASRVSVDAARTAAAAGAGAGTGVDPAAGIEADPAGDGPAGRPDAAPVAAMQQDIGEDIWGSVLEIYWPKAAADLQSCRAAMHAADAAALRASAHSLKGASASLGFESVAACAGALELGGLAAGPGAVDALETAIEAVRRAWSSGPVTEAAA